MKTISHLLLLTLFIVSISTSCKKEEPKGPETGTISTLNCADALNTGTLTAGTVADTVSFSVPYTGGNGGAHEGQTVSSTGVTGLTATLVAGTFAEGNGSLTYNITGTPSASGTASFVLNIGGAGCTLTRTVAAVLNVSDHLCGATNVHNPEKTYGTMSDQDGNLYKTIQIGTQTWMAENLKTTKYRNGNTIPEVTDSSSWGLLTSGAYCSYNNDVTNDCPYGKLYNWYAVKDSRNICPAGWHMPTDAEWNKLIKLLDPSANATAEGLQSNSAGGKMKSTGTQYWLEINPDATNESGFSGLPGGWRFGDGGFSDSRGYDENWWSATTATSTLSWSRAIEFGGDIYRYAGIRTNGNAVRCVKD